MKLAGLPRLGDALFIFTLAACLLVGQRMLNLDSDLGRHLALGRYILDSGHVPTRDILSFTRADQSRPPYEWLAQVAFSLAERLLGLDGVVLLAASVIAAAFLVVFVDGRQRGGSALLALGLTIWAAAASSLHFLTRPHVFSFLFLAIWLLLLDRLRQGDGRTLWQLPLVMLLWANFHGGFVYGFIAWAAYVLGWIMQHRHAGSQVGNGRHLVVVGVTSLVASMLTPAPGGTWRAVLNNTSPYVLARTAETLPVSLSTPATWPFLALAVIALILGLRRGRRLVISHVLLLLATAALGFGILRNIPLFCIAAVPIIVGWAQNGAARNSSLQGLDSRISSIDSALIGYRWAAYAVLVCAAILEAHRLTTRQALYGFERQRFPVAAVDWVAEHGLQGPTFNDLNWGGYLLYRMWPRSRVFIDSQSDFYGEQFIRQYEATYQASGDWQSDLDRYAIWSAILPPGAPLALSLTQDARWTIAYQDSTAVVFVRGHG